MPKIIGQSLADHRDQVRERLFAAMLRLIADRGYDAVTLADIAGEAGVGRTAVYNHFPDKESVLLALAEHETRGYLDRLQAALADVANPAERLMTLIRMQLTQMAGQHAQLAAIAPVLSEHGRRSLGEHVAPMGRILTETLAAAIAENYFPDQDLEMLVALVSAAIGGRAAHLAGQEGMDGAIEQVATFVVRGAGGRLDADGKPCQLADASA